MNAISSKTSFYSKRRSFGQYRGRFRSRLGKPRTRKADVAFSWFPLDLPKIESRRRLLHVLGPEGRRLFFDLTAELQPQVYSYLRNRGMVLSKTIEARQRDLVVGLGAFFQTRVNPLEQLYGRESLLNSKILCRPLGPLELAKNHPGHSILALSVGIATILLDPTKTVFDPHPAIKSAKIFQKTDKKTVFSRDIQELCEFWVNLDLPEINQNLESAGLLPIIGVPDWQPRTKDLVLEQVRKLIEFFPKDLSFDTLKRLFTLMRHKADGIVLPGSPGRFALFPLAIYQSPLTETPDSSFLLLYLPVFPEVQESIWKSERKSFGFTVIKDQEKPGYFDVEPYKISGTYPGALAYAQISLYSEKGSDGETIRRWGKIDRIQSDVIDHPADLVPEDLLKNIIPYAELLVRSFRCELE